MKKLLQISVFLILSISVLAQKQNNIKPKRVIEPSRFISGSVRYQINDLRNSNDWVFEHFYGNNPIHRRQQTFGGELNIGFKVGKKSDFLMGLAFQKYKIEQTKDFQLTFNRCDPKKYGAKFIDTAFRYVRMYSLNLPFEYRYKMLKLQKLTCYAAIGVSCNINLVKKDDIDVLFDNGVIINYLANQHTVEVDNPIHLAPFAKIGLRYQIIKPLFVKVEPFYTYHIGKERFLTETKNSNLFAYGVNVGVEYVLKK